MEKKEIDGQKSYIEVESITTARALYPHEAKFSQLIQAYYIKEKEALQQFVKAKNYSSSTDTLATITLNQPSISDMLEKSLQYAKDNNLLFIIYYIKLLGLKEIETIYGAHISNIVLNTISKRLMTVVGRNKYLLRVSKRKYLVGSLVKQDNLMKVENLVNLINECFSKPIDAQGFTIKIDALTTNIAYPIHADKMNVLLDIVEMKLFNKK